MRVCYCIILSVLRLCLGAGVALGDPGARGPEIPAHGSIEKLRSSLKIDGNLDEWRTICPVFLGRKEHLPVLIYWPGPQLQSWQGPDSAAMYLYAGWTDTALVVAAEVTDREPAKNILDIKAFRGVTLGVTSGRDNLQLTITPPVRGDLGVSVRGASADLVALIEKKGYMTPSGYRFEIKIPWKLLPATKLQAGNHLSLQLSLTAYGGIVLRRNMSQDRPVWPPQALDFVLADGTTAGKYRDLSLYSWIDTSCPCCGTSLKVRFETFPALTTAGKSVKLIISSKKGQILLKKQFSFAEFTLAGRQLVGPWIDLADPRIPDDGCVITAVVLNENNEPVGSTQYNSAALSLTAKRLLDEAGGKLCAAHLAELAQTEPFKASAWMGVVSGMEWVRRNIELHHKLPDNSVLLDRAMRELRARLAVLDGRDPGGDDAMMHLLRLTANPDSQVVVEFERTRGIPDRNKGSVSIDWGSLPLMTAQVEDFSTTKVAADFADTFKTPRTQEIDIAGNKCYYTPLPYWRSADLGRYDPSKEFLLMLTPRKIGIAPLGTLEENNVDALAFFPSCEERLRRDFTAWAAKNGKRIVDVSSADPKKRVAFLGSPDDTGMGKKVRRLARYRFAVSPQTGVLRFAKGTLAFTMPCLSLESGKLFGDAILKGRGISLEQADQIRCAVVRAIPQRAKPLTLPNGLDLYVGDVHGHTYYSDGSPSPLGLIAEAFYSHLDFCTVSDHHYHRNGVASLKPLMDKMKFDYPVIPSVELTYDWGHFNVYPLKTNPESFRDRNFTTVGQILEFAERQGNAVVQWSHPDDWLYTTRDDLVYDPGEGIEAWEGHPPKHDEWKEAGTLPVLTGGTDTHYGVFSNPVRTIILAGNPSGDSLAEAIRSRNCALIDPYDGSYNQVYWECYRNPRMNSGSDRYVYGDDRVIQFTVDALADGKYLKERKKKQIQKALSNLKLDELSSSERVKYPHSW